MGKVGRPRRMDELAAAKIEIGINMALQALNAHRNVKDAAAELKMSPTTLRDFMAMHNIVRREAVAYMIEKDARAEMAVMNGNAREKAS